MLFASLAIASLVVSINLIADGITQVVDTMSALEQVPVAAAEATAALELRDLDVVYRVRGRDRQVLRGVSLRVERGESVGLVGESGCGKSTAALAIVRYLPRNGRVRSGSVLVDGRDVWGLSGRELRALRSSAVSMVYQNPGAALNPSLRIGTQIAEVFTVRGVGARRGARALDRRCSERCRSPIPTP